MSRLDGAIDAETLQAWETCVRAGLTQKHAEVAATSLSALPSIAVGDVTARVDGEEEGTTVQENDIVTATVRVTLTRGSHALPGAA